VKVFEEVFEYHINHHLIELYEKDDRRIDDDQESFVNEGKRMNIHVLFGFI
jgi:hypothetical protein